jgi:hypothetical protein
MTFEQQIAENKAKGVDWYGRPLLSKEEIKALSEINNLAPVSLESLCQKAGF